MRRRLDAPWTLAIACAALAATAAWLAGEPAAQALVADGRAAAQPWRLLTGPLVHATWGHLARDGSLVLVVGCLYEPRLRGRAPWLVGCGLAAPPIAVLASGARGYLGLSGLAYALIAAAIAGELQARRGAGRAVAAALAALLAIKVVVEAIAPASSALSLLPRAAWLALGPGVRQAPLAHLAGAIAGALVMAAPGDGFSRSGSRRWRRARSIPAPPPTPA